MAEDPLLAKAQEAFPNQVVLKSLTQETLFQRVPRFAVENLLAHAGGTPEAVGKVRKILETRYLGPGHGEWIKDQLLRHGRFVLIDRLEVQVDLGSGTYRAHLPSLGDYPVEVPLQLTEEHPGTLFGLWGTVELSYAAGRVRLMQFYPFQASLLSLDPYLRGRARFSEGEWMDFLLGSVGLNPKTLSRRLKLLYLARLAPLVEPGLHLMELGPRQTGKTYLLRNTSSETFVISGGKVTPAVLFYNQLTRKPGLVPTYQVLVFDEIDHTAWEDPSIVSILKDYMESGQFSRGGRTLVSEASLVFLGNTDSDRVPLTKVLPFGLRGDTAFLDRIHGFLPGYEFPKITPEILYSGPGLVVDYLSAAFRLLRGRPVQPDLEAPPGYTQRDLRALRKWVSALCKLVYPAGDWSPGFLEEARELALELRERVYAELHHYNPEEFPHRPLENLDQDRISWEELPSLLAEEYRGLFSALRDLGLPPPHEGPEDLVESGRVVGQSLARWGKRRLVPPGLGRFGLEVAPEADPETVAQALRGR
ncbi:MULTISPECIES: BREX system Lon protease-like protein BrxL [unclassified Meiothermus]|uniref:BREX system Lon protease-like protein BrxL n=1 Tax=unclassified Meiothermus TaxID=370471 RepID=UPI000D7CC420|nr:MULTISPECIES: BREX system Lon protease-like protein BrxL [unclassified Meiothermus]PZA06056.1 BREX system Lon protease-like protein BrxL [Meiothermus sp. Pnk-1]RYM36149.1 BREX system Lon protease-like protein BrxL [Meiothermus sp. PNK-Is4]